MSLLEDVFLQDEANEAQELERVIEGDDFNERTGARSDSENNSEREGEAEEEKRRVDPTSNKTKRAVKNPRVTLNPARLTGPRGIQVIPEHFKDFKFRGKGYEKEDLDLVLKKLEHWAYRLYPKFKFEDCLKKIETLGKKRPVMVNLQKIRSDQFMTEDTVVQKDSSDDEGPAEQAPQEDEFDKLLQQQIELARSTPAPSSAKKSVEHDVKERSFIMPKATSSPSISDEQRERMLRSRKLAEEKRLARLKNSSNTTINTSQNNLNITDIPSTSAYIPDENHSNHSEIRINNKTDSAIETADNDTKTHKKKHNRSNVIESSDEEDNVVLMSEPITVDIHKNSGKMDADDFNKNEDCINDNDKEESLEILDNKPDNEEEDDEVDVKQISDTVNNNSCKDSEYTESNKSSNNDMHEKEKNGNKLNQNEYKNNEKSVNIEMEDSLESAVIENDKSNAQLTKTNEDCSNNLEKINIETKEGNDVISNNVEEVMDVDFSDDF